MKYINLHCPLCQAIFPSFRILFDSTLLGKYKFSCQANKHSYSIEYGENWEVVWFTCRLNDLRIYWNHILNEFVCVRYPEAIPNEITVGQEILNINYKPTIKELFNPDLLFQKIKTLVIFA